MSQRASEPKGAVSGYPFGADVECWVRAGLDENYFQDLRHGDDNSTFRDMCLSSMRSQEQFLKSAIGDKHLEVMESFGIKSEARQFWLKEYLNEGTQAHYVVQVVQFTATPSRILTVHAQAGRQPLVIGSSQDEPGQAGGEGCLVRPLRLSDVLDVVKFAARRCNPLETDQAAQDYVHDLMRGYFRWVRETMAEARLTCVAIDPKGHSPVWADKVVIYGNADPLMDRAHPAEGFSGHPLPLWKGVKEAMKINHLVLKYRELIDPDGTFKSLGRAFMGAKPGRRLVQTRDGVGLFLIHRSFIPFELPSPL